MRGRDRAAGRGVAAVAILGPAGLAGVLGAIGLTRRSLWLDEGATVAIASQHGAALWHGIAHDGGNMLGYYLGLHVLIGLFGDGAVVLRGPSVVAGMVTAGATVWLGRRWFGAWAVGAVAGTLCALSVPLLYWAQTARGYAPLVAAVTLSFVALDVLLRRPGRWPAVVWTLVLLLAVYLSFDAVVVLPAQAVVVLRSNARVPALRALWPWLVIVAAGAGPLVGLALHRGSDQLFWVAPVSGQTIWPALAALTGAGYPPNLHVTGATVAAAALVALAGLVGMRRALRHARHDDPWPLVAALWLGLTAVLVLLAGVVGEPLELSRIALLLVPAGALLVAWVLLHRTRGLGLGLLGALFVLRVVTVIDADGEDPEPWKAVVADLTRAGHGCVAFYPQDGREPFGYYVRRDRLAGRAPRPILPAQPWRVLTPHVEQYDVPSVAALATATHGCTTVWLVASHQGSRTGTAGSRRHAAGYRRFGAELAARYPASGPTVTGYGYAARITVTRYGAG